MGNFPMQIGGAVRKRSLFTVAGTGASSGKKMQPSILWFVRKMARSFDVLLRFFENYGQKANDGTQPVASQILN
jgi:hypothetical protein